MSLRGQGFSWREQVQNGYAMAALLVAMAVMAILMSAALPVWRHESQREKEEELIFRGQQYVRALRLYQWRTQTLPASVDQLVNGHFIRKKYKDPITGEDFELIGAAGLAGQTAQPGRGATPQTGRGATPQPGRGAQPTPGSAFGGSGMVPGGIMGVRSKSKDESIRLYQGRNHYNEWNFIFVQQQPGAGRGGPQRGGPQGGPQRGGPQRGNPDPNFGLPGFPGAGGRGGGPGRGGTIPGGRRGRT